MAATKKSSFGKHQEFHIRPFRTDKTNLMSGVVELHRTEDFDKPNFNLLKILAAKRNLASLSLPNLSCVGIERTYDEALGRAIYSFSLEGSPGDDAEQPSPDEDPSFELDVTMREEPIETHPSFETLARKYFWSYERKEFARNIPNDTSKPGLAAANDPSKRATNPMYGVTSYLVPGVVYRRMYTARSLPRSVLLNIGTIVEPPGIRSFPELLDILKSTQRNWLKLAPKVSRRGSSVSVVEEYLLSGPRGVLREVYDRQFLGS